jgi:peroxiredoxin
LLKYTESFFKKSYIENKSVPSQILQGDVGSVIKDIVLPDKFGSLISLQDVAKNSQKTVLVFWSPSCDHCLKDLPLYFDRLSQIPNKEIETYTVALSTDEPQWKQIISKYPNTSKHVISNAETEIDILKQFMIKTTPTYFVIDADLKVIQRFDSIAQLFSFLQQTK